MKKLITFLVLIGLISMLVVPVATARLKGTDFDIATTATVGNSGGSKPIVKVKWETPDDGDVGHTQDGTQMALVPSDIKPMITYVVVTDPDGREDIQGVFIDVLAPETAADYPKQKHAVRIGGISDNDPTVAEIHGALDMAVTQRLGAVNTAFYTNRTNPVPITEAEHVEIDTEIEKRTAYMYRIDCSMSYHDPAGLYTVKAYAVDKAGNVSDPLENQFLWVPTKVLEIDFENGVDFSPINIGTRKSLAGDEDMSTPAKPTVKNEGNLPLLLSVKQDPMVGAAWGKEVKEFDVQFLGQYEEFLAGDTVDLVNPLPLCNTKQIDFSVYPKQDPLNPLPADTYTGLLHLWVQ